jgi:hypothetical protein
MARNGGGPGLPLYSTQGRRQGLDPLVYVLITQSAILIKHLDPVLLGVVAGLGRLFRVHGGHNATKGANTIILWVVSTLTSSSLANVMWNVPSSAQHTRNPTLNQANVGSMPYLSALQGASQVDMVGC